MTKDKLKKLSIYGSILQGNESELKQMDYIFDGSIGSDFIVITKYK